MEKTPLFREFSEKARRNHVNAGEGQRLRLR